MPSKASESGAKKERKLGFAKDEEVAKTPTFVYVIIFFFIFCGTASTVCSKVMFQTVATGRYGQEEFFAKPLFQNWGMFMGMTGCLFLYEFNRLRLKGTLEERQSLLPSGTASTPTQPTKTDFRVYYIVLVPAFCDFLATYLMNIGLLWINASIWQMVRGSLVFFSALIRWFWLKKRIYNFQWFGVLLVMCALCIIGYACIMQGGSAASSSTSAQKLAGVALVFVAQMVQAMQTVVEEHLLHNVNASDLQIVGLEGFWGLLLCTFVAMPLAYYSPVDGLHEDTLDTFSMIGNSHKCMLLTFIYICVILFYNTFGMKLTKHLNSVTRNILDTVRTIFIWTTLTVVHYCISDSYGEPWTAWSWLQLGGFFVLISGLFTYYQVFTLPFFEYPDLSKDPVEQALATPRLSPLRKEFILNNAMPPHSPSFAPTR